MAVLPSPYTMRNVPQAVRPIAQINPKSAGLVGGAIAEFGQAAAGVGKDLQDHNDSLNLAGAKSEFLRARLAAEDEIPQGADYTQWQAQYEARLNESRAEIEKTLGPRAREAFQIATNDDIIRGSARMRTEARGKEADQGRSYLDDLIEKNIATAVTAKDTADRQTLLGSIGEAIDAAEGKGYVSAVQAGALRRKVSEDYAKRRLNTLDPEARLIALGGAPKGRLSPEIAATIEAAGGADAPVLKRIAVLESAGNPGASNESGAAGLFQFMPATAADYGLADPYDATASARAAAALLRSNRGALTNELGRAPSGGELYLAHQQGAGGAAALLRNRDMNVVDALAQAYGGNMERAKQAVIQNGGKTNMSAGQFADMWISKYNGVKGYSEGKSPDVGLAAYLPPDQVEILKRAAERDVEREMQRLEAEYTASFEQYLGAVSSGADISAMLSARFSDETINANISDAQVRELLKQTRDDAVMQAEFANRLTLASPQEVNQMISDLSTDAEVVTSTGLALAASRERAEGAFIAAAQADIKRRQDDPAGYVLQDTGVKSAADNIQDAPQDYARLSLLEQTRIGIPERSQRLMTKPMAQDYAQQFNAMKPDVVAQSIKGFREQWGEYGPRVIKEMEAAGLAPEYSVAMRHSDNPGLAAEIAGLRGTTTAEMKEGLPSLSVTTMTEELQAGLDEFRTAFEAGDVTGQALETFNLNYGVAEKLALKYIRGGMDPAQAAARVAERLFPETPVNTSVAKIIIPKGYDENTVTRHLETAMDADALRAAGIQPLDDPRLPEFADLEVMIEAIGDRGIWLNNDTGDGAVLHIDVGGYLLPITRKGGDFYEVPYAEAKPGGYKPIRPGSRTKNIPTDWTVRD